MLSVLETSGDAGWMERALALARRAGALGEVPVGAVLVRDGRVLGEGLNAPITGHDPSAHAEIVALRGAGARAGNYRLPGSVLYVTLEPCVMCAGAIIQARVAQVVYAAADPRAGAAGSVYDVLTGGRLNHRLVCRRGPLGEQAGALLRDFFRARRAAMTAPAADGLPS